MDRPVEFYCPSCGEPLHADGSTPGGSCECPACATRFPMPARPLGPGTRIAGYRILRRLGAGGMGEVFLAEHLLMRRWVALKILPTAAAEDEEKVESFLNEARDLGSLSHPCIAAGYDAGQDGVLYFLAMEYAEGDDLMTRLQRDGRWSEADALALVRELAGALGYAWKQSGLVHRDLKPGNVIVCADGTVKLLDLGVASTLLYGATRRAEPGMVVGTPQYMPPEQLRGDHPTDIQSDMFSLGVMLYHLVTGTFPFPGPSLEDVARQHREREEPTPRDLIPELSSGCESLVLHLMADSPDDRFADWVSCAEAIELALEGGGVDPSEPSQPLLDPDSRFHHPVSRKETRRGVGWGVWVAAVALIAPLVFCAWWIATHSGRTLRRTEPPVDSVRPTGGVVSATAPREASAAERAAVERAVDAVLARGAPDPDRTTAEIAALRDLLVETERIGSSSLADQCRAAIREREQYRQQGLRQVYGVLEREAGPLLRDGDVVGAARVFVTYDGPWAEDTDAQRRDRAAAIRRTAGATEGQDE